MNIDITGRHATVTEDLKSHARLRLEHVLRHHPEVVSAHVILDAERTRRTVEMVVHGRNLTAAVHADSSDHRVSIDRAAEKMRHYLEHHLERRHAGARRSRSRADGEGSAAVAAELAAMNAFAAARAAKGGEAAPSRSAAGRAPPVSRTRAGRPKEMSLADAARAFEKGGRDVLFFRDAERGTASVLYRRSDGKLAVIEVGASED